tara:strand:+ start:3425 stop:3880 length:456 start_codon:yes stop_codon:yes gene_type:complete
MNLKFLSATWKKLFLLVLCVSQAYGFVCPDARPVEFGEQSPCTGVLLPVAMLGELRLTLETAEADLIFCRDDCALRLKEVETKLDTANKLFDESQIEISRLQQIALDLADQGPPEVPWYESVPFVVTVTAAISISLAVGFYALADHMATQQ